MMRDQVISVSNIEELASGHRHGRCDPLVDLLPVYLSSQDSRRRVNVGDRFEEIAYPLILFFEMAGTGSRSAAETPIMPGLVRPAMPRSAC